LERKAKDYRHLGLFSGCLEFVWGCAGAVFWLSWGCPKREKWMEIRMVGLLALAGRCGRRLAPVIVAAMAAVAGTKTDGAAAMVGGAIPVRRLFATLAVASPSSAC
jgi:hypothetical protein